MEGLSRCQSQKDRADANAKDKAEAHAFDRTSLRHLGVLTDWAPRHSSPMTEVWKKQHEATMGDKNETANGFAIRHIGLGRGSKINCDPMGSARLYTYNYGAGIYHVAGSGLEFFELTHTWRTIWTDGRKLPDDPPEPRWLGWERCHWEGDTFVVESTGYDERRGSFRHFLPAYPTGGWTHSDELRLVERYRVSITTRWSRK